MHLRALNIHHDGIPSDGLQPSMVTHILESNETHAEAARPEVEHDTVNAPVPFKIVRRAVDQHACAGLLETCIVPLVNIITERLDRTCASQCRAKWRSGGMQKEHVTGDTIATSRV